tara:strand:- start:771142 stop:771582 length:441 start_codon:yes stop_codon:yes gene_type:complete
MSDDDTNQDDIDSIMNEEAVVKAASTDGEARSDDGMTVADALNLDEMTGELLSDEQKREFEIGEPMAGDVSAIYDIPVQISAVLGRSTMQVSQLLKLGRGAVVDLDRKVGEAIDIYVNNRLVARGEVVVVDDKLGITMTEIVKSDR